jgi:uncharacterized membrane protein
MRALLITLGILAFMPMHAHAQAQVELDTVGFFRARVVHTASAGTTTVAGTDTVTALQNVDAVVLEGPLAGTAISFENDYTPLATGDTFYARHTTHTLDSIDMWSVADPYRLPILGWLSIVFLVLVVLFGGLPGVRGFASLCGSIVLIFWLLIPGILGGYSPVLVAIGVASLIIIVGSYITHGFNKTTTAAIVGMIGTVLFTGALAYWAVSAAHLTGYAAEESIYLTFDTRGGIDLVGLLFGGIMIGLLGVLYDIAIGQAIAIEELFRAGSTKDRRYVFRRALRIGREHIGALVNTLAIAYVGASLPLLLLVSNSSTTSLAFTLNSEIFATEIIRILIGSIGLVLAVPITTLIAVRMLDGTSRETHAHSHVHH